jgi:hypothetical protein
MQWVLHFCKFDDIFYRRDHEQNIKKFDSNGLDYVSCSPFRVPIARLAAAQAAIKNKRFDSSLGMRNKKPCL